MAERSFANPADEEEPDVRDWFDQEPVLGKTAWLTVRRLARRASSSWLIWLSACVVVSGGLGAWRALRPSFYSSTVLLRVTEGTVELPGSELRSGELKLFVDSLVFTAENLRALMRRHAAKFPEVDQDPVTALHAFREHLDVNISGNDLVEDRTLRRAAVGAHRGLLRGGRSERGLGGREGARQPDHRCLGDPPASHARAGGSWCVGRVPGRGVTRATSAPDDRARGRG